MVLRMLKCREAVLNRVTSLENTNKIFLQEKVFHYEYNLANSSKCYL